MASIDKVTGGWRARWRTPEGASRSQTFTRKADAQRRVAGVEHGKAIGAYVDPGAGKVTFGDYATAWAGMQVHRATTAAQLETNLRRHVYPTLGSRPLAAIRPSEVQAWVKGRADVLSPGTVDLIYRNVVSVFRAAVADRLIASSPCVGVKRPRIEIVKVEPLPTETVRALIDTIPDRYRALVVLGAGTGLRIGEALGLTVDRLELLRRQVVINRQLVSVANRPVFLGPPKTPSSVRTIPLPDVVVEALASHLAEFPASEQLVAVDGRGTDPVRLVFTAADGAPIGRARWSGIWAPAARLAGIPGGIGFHALRHYYASLLIAHGESVRVVQDRLGHGSAVETLNTYAHLWPGGEDSTRAAIDGVLGAAVSPGCHQAVARG